MAKKKKAKSPKLLPTLKYLSHRLIASAVLSVFRANQKFTPIAGFTASADGWANNSVMRADVYARARTAWCKLADKDFTYFPYSEDYVAKLYMRFRKRNPEQLSAWEKELKEAS